MAVTRCKAYNAIVFALFATRQQAAFEVMLNGFNANGTVDPLSICDIDIDEAIKRKDGFNIIVRTEIFKNQVNYQGNCTTIDEICSKISETQRKDLLNNPDTKALINIYNSNYSSKPYDLVKNAVEEKARFYLPRTLTLNRKLQSKVFLLPGIKDIFVFKGISRHQLLSLVRDVKFQTDTSSHQLIQSLSPDVRHIQLERETEYNSLCERVKDNIHLIKFHNGDYIWKHTKGSTAVFQEYILYSTDMIAEDKLVKAVSSCKRPVSICVSNSTGMGKSELLKNFALKLSKVDTFVIYISFPDLVYHLRSGPNITQKSFIEFVEERYTICNIGKVIVSHKLTDNMTRPIFFLDGFDELQNSELSVGVDVLKFIRSTFTTASVFVATRPHLKNEVEEAIGTLSCSLQPLLPQKQIQFLVDYWNICYELPEKNLYKYAKSFIKSTQITGTDNNGEIDGTPLRCHILAEVYEKQIKLEISQEMTSVGLEIKGLSLFDSYQKIIKTNIQRLKGPGTKWFNVNFLFSRMLTESNVENVIMYCAFKELYPYDGDNTIIHGKPPYTDKIKNLGLFRSHKQNTSGNFLHRNEAEFWFAKLLVYVASDQDGQISCWVNKEKTLEFLFSEALAVYKLKENLLIHCFTLNGNTLKKPTFKNPTLALFINTHINALEESGKTVIPNKKLFSILQDAQTFEDTLTACMINGCHRLFKFFTGSEFFRTFPFSNSMLYFNPMKWAIKYANARTAVSYYEVFKNTSSMCMQLDEPSNVVTTLHVAVEMLNFDLVEEILFCNKESDFSQMFLLHLCLRGSVDIHDEKKLKIKSDIFESIVKHKPEALQETLKDKSTPILQDRVHLTLLKKVVNENQECLNDKTFSYDTVLHKPISSCNLENPMDLVDYKLLCKFAAEKGCKHFSAKNCVGKNPLHLAVETYEVDEELLQLFAGQGVSLNDQDQKGENIAFLAVRHGRTLKCLQMIINKVNYQTVNEKRETLLHLATKYGDLNVFQYVLDLPNIQLNSFNSQKNNALHLAVRRISPHSAKMQEQLIEKRIDCDLVNNRGNLPLVEGFRFGNGATLSLSVVELMENLGYQITPQIASKCITSMLLNSNIIASQCTDEFHTMLECMVQREGDFYFDYGVSVWKHPALQLCMHKIFATNKPAEKLVHSALNLSRAYGDAATLYRWDQVEKASLSRVLLLLLQQRMLSAFCSIRQCLRACCKPSTKFGVPPRLVVEHMLNDGRSVVVDTIDVDIFTSKIVDTIGGHIISHEKCCAESESVFGDILVVKVGENENMEINHSCFKRAKFVVFVSTLACSKNLKIKESTIIRDELCWSDLTLNFQSKLKSKRYKSKNYFSEFFEFLSETAVAELIKQPTMTFTVLRELVEKLVEPKWKSGEIQIGHIKLATAQAFPKHRENGYFINFEQEINSLKVINNLTKIEEDHKYNQKKCIFVSKIDCFYIIGAALASERINDVSLKENLLKKMLSTVTSTFHIYDIEGQKRSFQMCHFRYPMMVYSYTKENKKLDIICDKYNAKINEIICACILGNLLNPINEMRENSEKFSFDLWLAMVVIKYGSLQMIKMLITHCNLISASDFEKKGFGKDFTLMHLAVQRSDYSIVDYALHHLSCCKSDMFHSNSMKYLFKVCVSYTNNLNKVELTQRQRIFSLLRYKFGGNKEYTDEKFKNLLGSVKEIDVKLIKYLIDLKVDAFAFDEKTGYNIAHEAASYMNPRQYLELAKILIDANLGKIFKERNKESQSAIRCAILHLRKVKNDEELCEVLKLINKKAGIDFNLPNANHISILECANQAYKDGIRCKSVLDTIYNLGGIPKNKHS